MKIIDLNKLSTSNNTEEQEIWKMKKNKPYLSFFTSERTNVERKCDRTKQIKNSLVDEEKLAVETILHCIVIAHLLSPTFE